MGTVRSLLSGLSLCAVALSASSALAQQADNQAVTGVFERERSDYDAKGLPAGAFRIFPTLKVEEEYNDNIFAEETGEDEDFITRVQPGVTIESDWTRHFLSAYANSTSLFYADNDDEDRTDYRVGANGRLDVLRETFITGGASYAELHEDRGDPNAATSTVEPTEYSLTSANASFFRGLRRFSVLLDGNFDQYDYEDVAQNNGSILNNDDRDREKVQGGLRIGYEILPDYEAFVSGRLNSIDYDSATDDNGLNRDSDGYEVQAGIALDLGGKTRGELSAGYMEQTYDDPSLPDADGVTFGASILWNPTQLTSLRFNADRTIEETVQNNSSSYINSTAGIAVEHELLRNLLIGANVSYSLHEYEGIDREDDWLGAGAEMTYLVNPYASLDLNYDYIERDSNVTGQDYETNRVMAGIGVQF